MFRMTDKPPGLSPESPHEKMIATLMRRQLQMHITQDASKFGVRPECVESLIDRAAALFNFTSSGSLTGPDGLTTSGWLRHKARAQFGHLFLPASDGTAPEPPKAVTQTKPLRPETPRQRLDRANGCEDPSSWM